MYPEKYCVRCVSFTPRTVPLGLQIANKYFLRGLLDHAVIDDAATFANRLKAGFGAADLECHKMIVVIKARRAETASSVHVAASNLPRRARNKIMNPFLRFRALVNMIVTRDAYVYTVT